MAWTDKYWIAGGLGSKDGSSEANAWDTPALVTNAAAGQRVNMKASTDANTTTSRTFANAGSTTQPIWFRGYKTTIGDMDAEPSATRVAGTDIPSMTFTTAGCIFSGGHQLWSNVDFASARTAGAGFTVSTSTAGFRFDRCRFTNTGANAASAAVNLSAQALFSRCFFKAPSTATRVVQTTAATHLYGGAFEGGGVHVDVTSTATLVALFNAFLSPGSIGIQLTSNNSGVLIANNSFSSCGGDAIKWTTAVPTTATHAVFNNVFANTTGYDLNNSTGTATNFILRSNNVSFPGGDTTAHENGFGDVPDLLPQTEIATPFTSASDLSLVLAALARGSGLPGRFENESFAGFMSAGAVQLAAAAGGGGGPIIGSAIVGGMTGGMNRC